MSLWQSLNILRWWYPKFCACILSQHCKLYQYISMVTQACMYTGLWERSKTPGLVNGLSVYSIMNRNDVWALFFESTIILKTHPTSSLFIYHRNYVSLARSETIITFIVELCGTSWLGCSFPFDKWLLRRNSIHIIILKRFTQCQAVYQNRRVCTDSWTVDIIVGRVLISDSQPSDIDWKPPRICARTFRCCRHCVGSSFFLSRTHIV